MMYDGWIADLILGSLGVLLLIFIFVGIFVGIPLIVWFYLINTINVSMSIKLLVFIFFYMVYLILLKVG